MKNIFLIPTSDESRIAVKSDGWLFLTNHPYPNSPKFANHHIYITKNEDIKEGDYMLYGNSTIIKCETDINTTTEHFKMYGMGARLKIILTTDPKLIADGVQAIPDEFIEWFVKNPSCEEVEIDKVISKEPWNPNIKLQSYKIIIPKEEPKQTVQEYEQQGLEKHSHELEFKQETLEEETLSKIKFVLLANNDAQAIRLLEQYAEFQKKRSYSEEEVFKLLLNYQSNYPYANNAIGLKKWFEQFKKK